MHVVLNFILSLPVCVVVIDRRLLLPL